MKKLRYYTWRIKRFFEKDPDPHAELLRSYLTKGCSDTLKQCDQLIQSDEALKHFGQMWGKYKVETMLVLTAMEYEYIQAYDFTEAEIRVLRHFIGNIGLFYRGCKDSHDARQEAKEREARRAREARAPKK